MPLSRKALPLLLVLLQPPRSLAWAGLRGAPAPEDTLVWPKPQQHSLGTAVGHLVRPDGALASGFSFHYLNATAGGGAAGIITPAFARYTAIIFAGPDQRLATAAAAAAGGTLSLTLNGLSVSLDSVSDVLSGDTDESYTLTVDFPMATLHASTCFGALRGLETFSQLVQLDLSVRQQTVVDWPRFPFRGVLIDSGRHFLPAALIEAHLDAMGTPPCFSHAMPMKGLRCRKHVLRNCRDALSSTLPCPYLPIQLKVQMGRAGYCQCLI